MLKCATSLWSADLANLAAEIRRVEPFSERFHLDVADGHYVPTLLFFPDLIKSLRPVTRVPFEVHLMTADPLAWIEPFAEAGADGITFCFDSAREPSAVLQEIRRHKLRTGISLSLDEPLEVLDPYWNQLDLVCVIGTPLGVKGCGLDAGVPEKIRRARAQIRARRLSTEIEADGGIRRETVPLLAAAGADFIVPGSLMFQEDPPAMRNWLATLTADAA